MDEKVWTLLKPNQDKKKRNQIFKLNITYDKYQSLQLRKVRLFFMSVRYNVSIAEIFYKFYINGSKGVVFG